MRKTTVSLLLALMLLLCLSGCSRYSSSFKAVMLVSSNTSKSASMSFSNFTGTKVFKMNCKSASGGILEYSGKLEGGSATVYYDNGVTKTELFSIKSGETLETMSLKVNPGTVYVIVETDGTCREGRFDFKLI